MSVKKKSPTISPEFIAEVAKMFVDQTAEREKSRLAIFNRVWECSISDDQRVALAVAFLGGNSK